MSTVMEQDSYGGSGFSSEGKPQPQSIAIPSCCYIHPLESQFYCTADNVIKCTNCLNPPTEQAALAPRSTPPSNETGEARRLLHSIMLDISRRASTGRVILRAMDNEGTIPMLFNSEAEDDVVLNPTAVAVSDTIRSRFALLRAALDAREQELLHEVDRVAAVDNEMKRLYVRHNVQMLLTAQCDAFVVDAEEFLQATSDAEFKLKSLESFENAELIKQKWGDISSIPPGHLTVNYTNYDVNDMDFQRLMQLSSISSNDVVPHMSTCKLEDSIISEGAKTLVHIELRNYVGNRIYHTNDGCHIKMVSSRGGVKYCVEDNSDGTCQINFSLSKEGFNQLYISYGGYLLGSEALCVTVLPSTSWGFGSSGINSGQFRPPWGVTIGINNDLYVSDSGNGRIQVFSSADGAFIRTIGCSGKCPRGVCCSRNGYLYVADAGNCCIQMYYQASGEHIDELRLDENTPQLIGPWGIVEDCNENIYVSDMNGHSIQVLTSTGHYIRSIGSIGTGPGELLYPRGLCCSPYGFLYVADPNNSRIQVFNISDGSYCKELPGHSPMDLSFGVDGRLYMSDFVNSKVDVLDPDTGAVIESIGGGGSSTGGLRNPCGIFRAQNGTLYVADAGNCRIQVFSHHQATQPSTPSEKNRTISAE